MYEYFIAYLLSYFDDLICMLQFFSLWTELSDRNRIVIIFKNKKYKKRIPFEHGSTLIAMLDFRKLEKIKWSDEKTRKNKENYINIAGGNESSYI